MATRQTPQERDAERAREYALEHRHEGPRSPIARLTAGGSVGNEELTAVTGVLLLVLLAALGVTILRIRPLLNVHMFVGLLLIPPIGLKLASTGYRFVRYYTHDEVYRRKGPPELFMRLLAPLVVLLTTVVFATGVALLFIGPSSRGELLKIHKLSFFAWLAVTAVHVLGHLPDLARVFGVGGAPRERTVLPGTADGRAGRALSLAAAIVLGAVIAILLIPEFAPWLNLPRDFRH
jgi:hypothetical protein